MSSLNDIEKFARERKIPIILNDSLQILISTIKENNPKNILEIGTAIGFSGAVMLQNCSGFLTTIELSEERIKEATENFASINASKRVTQLCGDANLIIENLGDSIFDMVFLDGPKSKYAEQLLKLIPHLSNNAIIFADNIYFKGMVKADKKPPHKYRTIVVHMRKFIDMISNAPFDTTFYNVGDGVSVSKYTKKQ